MSLSPFSSEEEVVRRKGLEKRVGENFSSFLHSGDFFAYFLYGWQKVGRTAGETKFNKK
jgi:hypothetical protein